MKIWSDLSQKWKQTILFLLIGLGPLVLVMVMNNFSFKKIRDINAATLQDNAEAIADKIDRNLFERYGDVQAFGLNHAIRNRQSWYQKGGPIVVAMNQYVDTYDIYYTTLLVDLEGKPIAVNTRDQDGQRINNEVFYSKNYSNEPWFQDVINGKFYTSQKGNVGGSDSFSGTVIVPLHVNEAVKKAYPGDSGLTVGFASPVYDAQGRVMAIWHNYAKFSLVEEIFLSTYRNLKKQGKDNVELTLLDGQGRVIVDLDPALGRGSETAVPHNFDVFMKLNLAELGVKAAIESSRNKKVGFDYAMHARKKIVQAAGYAHLKGALGFPGMDWSVLVRMPDEDVNAAIFAIENQMLLLAGGIAILIFAIGIWSASSNTRPIIRLTRNLECFARGSLREVQEMDVRSEDEIGRLSRAFNGLYQGVLSYLKCSDELLRGEIPQSDSFGLEGEFEDKLKAMRRQASEKKEADEETAKIRQMVEGMNTNVMFADTDLVIQYMNPASLNTLKTLERLLPIKADQVVGQKIDIFHKNPEYQRNFLADPKNLPHRAQIELGDEILNLTVVAINDQGGNVISTMAAWSVVTEIVNNERAAKEAAEREQELARELQVKVDSLLGVVNAASEGDLTQEVTVSGADAIGQMGEGLSKFFQNLRRSVTDIGKNADSLSTSSNQLNEVSQQMAGNAEETSAQAGVVSAASEEVSKNVDTVATGAEEMHASIKEISLNANEAAKIATEAVRVAENTNVTVGKLGESSAEIGQVVKVITSIAEQTNLLALNATIEAARAGEAGKGFAVVANEVKDLANQTAKATEEISEKIEAIQTDTGGAVSAIAEISEVINKISDISNTIASAVEEQTATTSEIGRNVTEAAKGTQEIAENITGVANAAQSTTQGAGDTQTASSELSHMATELQKLVGQFRY